MCANCGCQDGKATLLDLQTGETTTIAADHQHGSGSHHSHDHDHDHTGPHDHVHHHHHHAHDSREHAADHHGHFYTFGAPRGPQHDLLPNLDFALSEAIDNVAKINPDAAILQVSARSGQGMTDWYDWLRSQFAAAQRSAFA